MSAQFSSSPLTFPFDEVTRAVQGPGSAIFAGWFQSTNLAATRTWWSSGTTRLYTAGSPASELTLVVDRGTTDTTVTTSGASLVEDKWYFVAVVIHGQGTPNTSIWLGTETSAPVELTTSATAGTGNVINSTTLTLGANSGGSATFTGYISQFIALCTTEVIRDIEPDSISTFTRFVYPMYLARYSRDFTPGTINLTVMDMAGGDTGGLRIIPLDCVSAGSLYTGYLFSTGTLGAQASSITFQSSVTTLPTFTQLEPNAARFSGMITNGFAPSLLLRR